MTYMWNLKYDKNELTNETEMDSQRIDFRWPSGERGRGGMDLKSEMSRCKLFYIEWMQSTGNCIQYFGINHSGKEYEKRMHLYV